MRRVQVKLGQILEKREGVREGEGGETIKYVHTYLWRVEAEKVLLGFLAPSWMNVEEKV